MTISYDMLCRFIERSHVISLEPAVHPDVKSLHDDVLLPPATTYLDSCSAVPGAETRAQDAIVAASSAIGTFDPVYRTSRLAVVGRFPNTVVPGTLKDQPTDTDRMRSIQKLLGIIEEHRGAAWADGILAGAFGTQAPNVIGKITAADSAKLALLAAYAARSDAFDPAYTAYLAFKAMLRQQPGPFGGFYRRLREPVTHAVATPAPAPSPEPPVVEPPVVATAPTNGAGLAH